MIAEDTSEADSETENYFVSMTDMMVGVLFIFIILLMVFALNFRTSTDTSEDQIKELRRQHVIAEDVQRQLATLQARIDAATVRLADAAARRRELLQAISGQLKTQGLDVIVDDANGVIRLTEHAVRFDSDKSIWDPKDTNTQANVEKIARVLFAVLPDYTACRGNVCRDDGRSTVETVFIEGHTDSSGTDDRNWQLATERATNTYRHMVAKQAGLPVLRNRKGGQVLAVSGYAAGRPIDPAATDPARARNRRIDLRFSMDIDDRAMLDEISLVTDRMRVEIGRMGAVAGAGPFGSIPARIGP
ncbi:Flagellar motor protein MotB [Rhizobiales bacterium GAS113]|nr:Flagellar motor protein MotB [Rhizobiales bacterium GAS113]